MSGRDSGRGGRGGFGDRGGRPGFGDRDDRRGGFRDREGGGGFRDRGGRDAGGPPPRPWERRDDDRPARPSGDRPFDRPAGPPPDRDRPAGPPPDRDVRVERYYDEPGRPPREDRPARFGGDRPPGDRPPGDRPMPFRREGGDARPAPPAQQTPERPPTRPSTPTAEAGDAATTMRLSRLGQGWSNAHLTDSWLEETRLKGWTPSDQDQQEMVEDNIEADPQVPGRDRRSIAVRARSGTVTLTGTVRSRAAKFAAGSDAYWTFGVNEVRNELVVTPRGPQAGGATAPKQATPAPAVSAPAAPAAAEPSTATSTVTMDTATEDAGTTPTPEEVMATVEGDTEPTPPEETLEVAPAAAPKRASRRKAPVVETPAESDDEE